EPERDVDRLVTEEQSFLTREEARVVTLIVDLREPAARERRDRDQSSGEDREVHQAAHDLADVTTRRLTTDGRRRELREHAARVLEGELLHEDVSDELVDVLFQARDIVAPILRLDVIGPRPREVTARVPLAPLLDRDVLREASLDAARRDLLRGAEHGR